MILKKKAIELIAKTAIKTVKQVKFLTKFNFLG